MQRQPRKLLWLLLLAASTTVAALDPPAAAGVGMRDYRIAQSYPYPPWDVGPLEGVSIDVLHAICNVNAPMRCEFTPVRSEECFDTDAAGHPVIGDGLATGRFDGCLTWFTTAARQQLGAEFGHGYSTGSIPQLIASDGNTEFDQLGATGSLGGAAVTFFAGFFSDAACLGAYYTDFEASASASDNASRAARVSELLGGSIDLIFWDNVSTVPEGTHVVGAPVTTCGPDELGLAVYPPSERRKHRSDALRRDYNCGLALIRMSGALEAICSGSPHAGGDPACVLDDPPPTIQCLRENRLAD
jgi:hypothetical protein